MTRRNGDELIQHCNALQAQLGMLRVSLPEHLCGFVFSFFPFPLRVLVPDVCLGLLYVFTLAKIIPFAEYRAEIVASPVAGKMVGQAGGRPGGQAGR